MHPVVLSPSALDLRGTRPLALAGGLPPPPRLAVVGSRAAHRRFRDAVEPIVDAAARAQWSVVSGGAIGIDADAHAAALALGVPQLAVLPCGPDRLYPPQHAALFEQIAAAAESGVLFAHPAKTTVTRGMFASRNAIVVALADAVVLVEAAPRSGTMLTARLACRKQRALAVVAGSAGASVAAADGAHVLPWDPDEPARLRRDAGRWLAAVASGQPLTTPTSAARPWPSHLQWLCDALDHAGSRGLSVDMLPSPRTALLALTEAEALGLVVGRAGDRYVRAP